MGPSRSTARCRWWVETDSAAHQTDSVAHRLTPWPAKPTPKGGTSTLRSHGIWKTTMIEGTEYQI